MHLQEDQATKDGYIDVLNEKVQLSSSYIKYFVLAEWDVTDESLAVHFEKDEALETIERVAFLVNTKSRIRYKGW